MANTKRPGAMTPHDLERYRKARHHGRVVRVHDALCFDCIRAVLMRIPENAHNVFNHTHMVLMGANAATSAAIARGRRDELAASKALAETLRPGAE